MSMVKIELANIRSLLKVKIKTGKRLIMWLFILAALAFIGQLVPTVVGITLNNEPGLYYFVITDFSTLYLFGIITICFGLMFWYRKNNDSLSVFPQSNTGRFVTSQIVNYFIAVCAALAALAAYLLMYGVLRIMTMFNESVHLALDFDMGFLIAGLFASMLYTFLLIAVIGLVGVIIRKWTYYAAIAFAALLSLAIINLQTVVDNAAWALRFLVHEPSLGIFALKAAGLWLVISAVSLIINYFTVYYKVRDSVKMKRTVAICAVIAVLPLVLIPLAVRHYTTTTESTRAAEWPTVSDAARGFFADAEEIWIDVSHVPRGSNIGLGGENIDDGRWAGGAAFVTGRGAGSGGRQNAFVSGRDSLTDIQGDAIVIQFMPPFFHVNGVDVMRFANPRLDVRMNPAYSTLYLDYNIDTANVVLLPVWGVAAQFDAFRGRNIVTGHLLGFSAGGSMTANILISVAD